jgi:hypothetical protein
VPDIDPSEAEYLRQLELLVNDVVSATEGNGAA